MFAARGNMHAVLNTFLKEIAMEPRFGAGKRFSNCESLEHTITLIMGSVFRFLRHLPVASHLPILVLATALVAQAAPVLTIGIGTLAVIVPGGKPNNSIEIPDIKLELLDSQNAVVGRTITQLDGSFRIKAPAPGVYSLCWNIQDRKGCKREVVLSEGSNSLRRVETRLEGPLIFGRVLTGDHRPCWVNDPFFKLDVSTRVELRDSQGQPAANDVRANVRGDYLFVAPNANEFEVRASCEKAQVRASLLPGAVPNPVNLDLGNHAPRIIELAASDGVKALVRVATGTPFKLVASVIDRDGDPVEHLWRDNDGQPVAASNASTLARTASVVPGRHSTYLIARDGRGGYAFKRFDLEVGAQLIEMSGIAIDETSRQPVANAVVEFGGITAKTNARGWFSLSGPTNADDRYVLNIRHANYALMSRVYDRSSTGNTYELIRAQVRRLSPLAAINVTDTNSSGPCGDGKPGSVTNDNGTETRRLQSVEIFDPDVKEPRPLPADLIKLLTEPRDCLRQGAQITIPAKALVRVDGKKIVGEIRMAMATLDPTRRALPGDYQAIDGNNKRTELLSYGAAFAEFRDASGALLNLAAGRWAKLRMPVPLAQRATAKPSIDFWSYNEKTGRWALEGKAQLINTTNGPAYVGETRHFSTLNMDVAGNDINVATCARFEVGTSLAAWTNLKLRATVSYNGNAVQTKETFINGDQYHGIFRIPFGTGFPPNTLRVELFGTFNGRSVALVDNIINTDARPKMIDNGTPTALWPPYPYSECGAPITLNADPIALPAYASNDATNRPYFLTGPSGHFLPPNGEASATVYYAAIDPGNAKTTLGDWWVANGFGASDGSGGTRAAYLNFNDLGFGRDMNCKNSVNKLACYVTNYGAANQDPANADAAETRDPAKRGATVAMEFDPAAGAEGVQFYVYANTGPSSVRLKFADLDGFGPKPVPQLCQVCHGGDPGLSASGKSEHSRFREFDLPSFKYSGNRSWDYGQATLNATELSNFGTLNQKVRGTLANTTPIHGLISAWYPGSFTATPAKPTAGNVPTGWAGNLSGYNDVYGKTCRTCHVARDGGTNPPGYYTFNQLSVFQGLSYVVCGLNNRVMPNAIVTYKNFWADTPRVLAFEALMNPPIAPNTCAKD